MFRNLKTTFSNFFSNRSSKKTSSLASSDAQIKLYVGGKSEVMVFNVPNEEGTLWEVFKIENGEVVPINKMSYCTDPSNVGK